MDGMRFIRATWSYLSDTYAAWREHNAPRLGAALAYYTVFSIAPLLVIVIGIAGLVFGADAARGQVMAEIEGLIGPESARALQDILKNAQSPTSGTVATIIGVVSLILGASGVFGDLQAALNTVWEVKPKPNRALIGVVKERFLSLTMVLGTGFLLLVSLLLSAALAAAGKTLHHFGPGLEALAPIAETIVSLGVLTLLFALIFKYLPDATIAWGDVWIGAVLTAALFVVGKLAIGLYLGHAGIGSAYGAAGSLVVILVWVYYSAQILLFGAELTRVCASRRKARVKPARGAVKIRTRGRSDDPASRSA